MGAVRIPSGSHIRTAPTLGGYWGADAKGVRAFKARQRQNSLKERAAYCGPLLINRLPGPLSAGAMSGSTPESLFIYH